MVASFRHVQQHMKVCRSLKPAEKSYSQSKIHKIEKKNKKCLALDSNPRPPVQWTNALSKSLREFSYQSGDSDSIQINAKNSFELGILVPSSNVQRVTEMVDY